MEEMLIAIPSHNREDSARYLKFVPKEYLKNIYIFVRAGEQYEKYHDKHAQNGVNIISAENLTGIHDKRDYIARFFAGEKIWMIDDDVELHNVAIRENGSLKSAPLTDKDFYECMEWCSDLIEKYPYSAIRSFMFPTFKHSQPYELNKWTGGNALLNLNKLDADVLDYKWSNYAEDVVAFLNTITAGYDCASITKWMTTTDKPGKKGGMTDQRPVEKIESASRKINARFPEITGLFQSKYVFPGHNRAAYTLRMRLSNIKKIRSQKTSSTIDEFFR